MDIVITNQITPTFTQIGPLCQNSTAPALPTTSTNGITGTWSPATINTSTVGTTTYTFTPAAGQCAGPVTMDIVITTQITPTFTQIGPLCQNSTAPALPTTSTNGITGTWSPATINTSTVGTTTYTFTPAAGQCAVPVTMDIVITTQITPTFTQIGPLCQNSTAPTLPATSSNGITGTWSPATINTSTVGTTTYTFTPAAGQCAVPVTMDIVITTQITPTFTQIGPLCQNSTAPALPATSTNGITGTWSPATINTSTVGTTTYTFTPAAGQCAVPVTMDIVITTQITPTFTQIGPLCQNSTAPTLPGTSTNGITGTWSPATINTSTVGTTTYTFTPAAGQCAVPVTMDIVITTQITPTFTQIGPLCQNSTAPTLPGTSTNGITGTWSPATINTSTVGTTTYTFTPAAGQCAVPVTMDIVITTQITPTFTQIGPLCQNSTAPTLPGTSTNGITGTWSPATINTSTVGTITYTFTPAAGQCAVPVTMDIVITTQITPTFTQIGPLCQNSTAPTLPGTSTNGITGTWSPATINTSTVGTTTYTFTPAAGQCAGPVTMDIVITTQITPTFTQIGPLCQNSTAPTLPGTSTNGITGTWSPATINTSTVGTITYTFTPAAGQCAVPVTMDIVITTQITPTFTQIGPLCQNSAAPTLPGTSSNGITGTWSPATINTSTVGTITYTFTPAAGQCAVPVTMDIVITTQITPTFTQIGPLCQNSAAPTLPGTSSNGITGTWSPATINTSTVGTTTYTFTPAAGQCAVPVTMDIVITTQITPTFTQIGPLCQNSTAPTLPGTSTNGITGTWSPASINTSTVGTITYTFTPAAGQCAVPVTMDIVITTQITPTFTQIGPLCQNSTAPTLPGTSSNGITGTWSPATINTSTVGTTTYTFTPAAGQCAVPVTMDIVITTQITPTFTQIGPLCQNSAAPTLPGTSNNGITGTWSPATINTSTVGTTTYTFTPAAGQCAGPVTMDIVITTQITPTFTQIGPLCQNSTAPTLPGTSNNGITGTWSPATINTSTVGTITYTFTPAAGQCAGPVTMDIVITTQITPTFTQIGPLCQNSTAPTLPGTSNNGITGTWSPATINTSTVGTITYTFTPAAGQCAVPVTMDIVITTQITPTFTQIGPLCQNSAAPTLPGTSNNGITGTWSPATINTSTVGTTTYTFTPAGQCAVPVTMDIVITTQITPTFTQIGPLCQNSTAPALPTTSTNGITGTWSPATINTSTVGTTTYTFTPAAGQCAVPVTMDIVITTQITPTFTQIGPLCQNSIAPALPTTSTNGITGTWSPATISTSTVGTTTYTFTPAAGQCAVPVTMDIVITTQITPTFTQIGPLCQNSTAPTLPGTSNNGITGTWSPAVINTSVAGTVIYTFTPTAGQCALPATISITIASQITPTFTQVGPLCQNSTAPTLPTTSNNNITGTWNPATISTATVGVTTYTFTPAAGQCAGSTAINVRVNRVTSSSTNITICNNQLPYSWNGNNYTAAGTFSVTLQNAAGCDSIATLILRVNSITTSTTRDSICANQAPYVWNGNNYTASGNYSVTLVNSAGCDSIATLILLVKPIPALVINQPSPVCEPMTINLTAPSITAGSDPGLVYTYWMDSLATIPITNPNAIGISGTYYIKAQGGNSCTSTKPVAVTVLIYKLIAGIRYPTITTQANTATQLSARNIGLNYTWSPPVGLSSPFVRDPVFNHDRTTEYLINIARDNGCITVDTILIKIIERPTTIPKSDLFVPKAWTPNNDGHNDKLFPLTVNIRELKYFRVFNRWGQLVFETNVIGLGWDGIFHGKPAVMDVYTWTAEAIGVDGKHYKKAGNSVLIR